MIFVGYFKLKIQIQNTVSIVLRKQFNESMKKIYFEESSLIRELVLQ
jgi:hypothetical protein